MPIESVNSLGKFRVNLFLNHLVGTGRVGGGGAKGNKKVNNWGGGV